MIFKDKLDSLWATKIESFNFDIANNRIVFFLEALRNGPHKKVKLEFTGVSAYYFVNEMGKDRFKLRDFEPGDYMELTSITFNQEGFGEVKIESEDIWAKEWCSSANFAIEIWTSALFIEAQSIVIEDEVFEVGQPRGYDC